MGRGPHWWGSGRSWRTQIDLDGAEESLERIRVGNKIDHCFEMMANLAVLTLGCQDGKDDLLGGLLAR